MTAFLRAADQYHIERISNSLSAQTTIDSLNKKFPPQVSPFVKTPSYLAEEGEHTIMCHLDVLLSKLLIYREDFTCLPQLSPHGLKLGKEVCFKNWLYRLAFLALVLACSHCLEG